MQPLEHGAYNFKNFIFSKKILSSQFAKKNVCNIPLNLAAAFHSKPEIIVERET